MSTYTLTVTTPDDTQPTAGAPRENLQRISNQLRNMANGAGTSTNSLLARTTAVQATGSITLATCLANTIILVNGVPFRAKGSAATTGNNEFDISGGTDALDATALAAAINASTTAGISGVLTASSTGASGVVTVTATVPGAQGNGITLESLGVVATAVITCASVVEDDTVTLNGVVLTAMDTVVDADAEFAVGATNTITATNLAALINSCPTAKVTGCLRATSAAAVVTVFSKLTSYLGNIQTVATSDGATLAITGDASGRLSGGAIEQGEGGIATGSIAIAGGSGNYTAVVNGVTTGDVAWDTSDAITAAALCAAFNALTDTKVFGLVRAAVLSGSTVTFYSLRGGVAGNLNTLAGTGTGTTVSGTYLTGGAAPTTNVCSGPRLTGGSDTAVTVL